MRKIKFRGKCAEEIHTHHEATEIGQWIYGYLIDEKTISHKMSEEHGGIGPGIVTAHVEVDPETVGQFTGLKDINNTMIYEGDILLETGDAVIVRIGLPENKNYYKGIKDLNTVMVYGELDDGSSWIFEKNEEWGIIGNIHDNPELLEE